MAPEPRCDNRRVSDTTSTDVSVTVLVPVFNERAVIADVLDGIRAQRLEGGLEILLIDGGSTDGSVEILKDAVRSDPRLVLLHNPDRHISAALNLGLRHARGRYVARMDAHTRYPLDYLAAGVGRLAQGDVAWVSGPPLPLPTGAWSRRVAIALRSRLGVGGGIFRNPTEEVEVTSGFTGMWRRETLEAIGGWDTGWQVNEDAEMGGRIRAAGGRIVCIPEMRAEWMPRNSLQGLARQYFRWGFYRVKTAHRHVDSMRRPHLLPLAVLGAIPASLVGQRQISAAARSGLAVYGLAVAGESLRHRREAGWRDAALLMPVFVTMHLAWAAGFVAGCARVGVPWSALLRLVGITGSGTDRAASGRS
jgi:succinoglycan biosynthesis protein ExoA